MVYLATTDISDHDRYVAAQHLWNSLGKDDTIVIFTDRWIAKRRLGSWKSTIGPRWRIH